MPIEQDLFDRNMKYYRETGASPQSSYSNQFITIRQGQILHCLISNTYWFCTNATNQEALVWQRLLNAPIITAATFNNATTAQKLSQYLRARVSYTFPVAYSATVIAGQTITAFLRYADNVGMSQNVVTVDTDSAIIQSGLVVTLGKKLKLSGDIILDKFRQVTFSVVGSGATAPTTLDAGQECLE